MDIVSVYIPRIHSAAKQVEGCFCNWRKQTVFVLRNNMQWTATRSEALSSKAPRVGTENRVGTCGIVHAHSNCGEFAGSLETGPFA